MRKYLIACLLFLFTMAAFSQQDSSITKAPKHSSATYLQKSKRQTTTGWVLTTAGTTGLLVTLVADAGQVASGVFINVLSLGYVQPEYKPLTTYYLLSTAAVAGGIIAFISAGNNKKQARALQTTFKMEQAPVLQLNGLKQKAYPSVGLCISL